MNEKKLSDWATAFALAPRLRFDIVSPAEVKQYERALGRVGGSLDCIHYDPTADNEIADYPCTGHAEIRVVYLGRDDIKDAFYCRACAGELVEQLQAAIDMHDAMDDPRRDTT